MGAPQGRTLPNLTNLTDQFSTNQHPQKRVCLLVGASISPRQRCVPQSFSAEITTSIPSPSTLSMPEPLRVAQSVIQLSKQPSDRRRRYILKPYKVMSAGSSKMPLWGDKSDRRPFRHSQVAREDRTRHTSFLTVCMHTNQLPMEDVEVISKSECEIHRHPITHHRLANKVSFRRQASFPFRVVWIRTVSSPRLRVR